MTIIIVSTFLISYPSNFGFLFLYYHIVATREIGKRMGENNFRGGFLKEFMFSLLGSNIFHHREHRGYTNAHKAFFLYDVFVAFVSLWRDKNVRNHSFPW